MQSLIHIKRKDPVRQAMEIMTFVEIISLWKFRLISVDKNKVFNEILTKFNFTKM